MEAQAPILDSSVEHRHLLDKLLATESAAIGASLACSVSGDLLQDDAIVSDLFGPSDSGALCVELLTPPSVLSTAGVRF